MSPFRGNLSFCFVAIHPRAATTLWHHGIGYRDGTSDGVLCGGCGATVIINSKFRIQNSIYSGKKTSIILIFSKLRMAIHLILSFFYGNFAGKSITIWKNMG
ncbi:MAG: hypothetical protein CW341_03165 [Bacteroidetes bacterium]|nr:hypothetical protein [Bacteroidota bacterium]